MRQARDTYKWLAFCLMAAVFVAGIFIGFRQIQPPKPPAESNANYPAYQQMLTNLQAMTVAPHVPGSAEIEAVRAHLLAEITAMGLQPTVEDVTLTAADIEAHAMQDQPPPPAPDTTNQPQNGPNGPHRNTGQPEDPAHPDVVYNANGEVTLKNILVKIDAPNTDSGVLFMAHYDTENVAPGAADDMVSVSALLEAMRKQSSNPNLKNDLYFLFTDGEELKAMGAEAFVAAHPELKNHIQLVVNFEARGNRGGLFMFETSAHNYDAVRYYRHAVSTPIAFGFTAELYKYLPNGTDLTEFLNAGYAGLNFAVAEGVENYHEPTDTFENLNRGTAYQFLLTALEMSDYAATTQFQNTSKQDGVYFPFWPGNVVLMSKLAAYVVSGLAGVAAVVWLAVQIRHKKLRVRQIAIDSGWLLGTIAVTAFVSWGIVALIAKIFNVQDSTNTVPIFLGLSLVWGAVTITILTLRMRKVGLNQAVAGLLPVLVLLIAISTVYLYTVSYLFALPTLALLAVALLNRNVVARLVASSIFGVGILLLYVPVCWLLYVLFMLPGAPMALALGVIPVAMLTALFTTHISSDQETPRTIHSK